MNRLESLNEMIKQDPTDPFLQYALALEHEKSEDIHKAVGVLELLRQYHPDYLPTYYKLGKLYELLLNNIAAIAVYKMGIELAKKTGEKKTLAELNEAVMNLED